MAIKCKITYIERLYDAGCIYESSNGKESVVDEDPVTEGTEESDPTTYELATLTPAEETSPAESEEISQMMKNNMPRCLKTLEAIAMLDELVARNILDDDYKPLCDPTEAVVVADCIGTKLQIKQHWKPFEKIWGMEDMKNKYQYSLKKDELIGFRKTINYYLDCAIEKVKLTIKKR